MAKPIEVVHGIEVVALTYKDDNPKRNCSRCVFEGQDLCFKAPCYAYERADNRSVIFVKPRKKDLRNE